jgi:hypothetical protein
MSNLMDDEVKAAGDGFVNARHDAGRGGVICR